MKKSFLIVFALFFYTYSYAGFPIGKGRTVFCFTYSYFFSDHYFDNNSNLKKSQSNFSSHFAALYVAHGVSRKLDVFVSVPYVYEYALGDSNLYRNDFGDMQLGASLSFPNPLHNKYTSVKLAAITPLSHGQKPIPVSYDASGLEFSLGYFRARQSLFHRGYFSIEGIFRHYFAIDGPDQFLLNLQRFVSISKYSYLDYGLNSIYSYSIDKSNNSNNNSNKDFYNIQFKMSLCRKLRRNLSAYLEGYTTIIGRNTGLGYGGSIFAVLRIP